MLGDNDLAKVEIVDNDTVKNKGEIAEKKMEIHLNMVQNPKSTRAFTIFEEGEISHGDQLITAWWQRCGI